jgi:hypothetical protein
MPMTSPFSVISFITFGHTSASRFTSDAERPSRADHLRSAMVNSPFSRLLGGKDSYKDIDIKLNQQA